MAETQVKPKTATKVKPVRLTSRMLTEVSDLYARVFAGPPWFEVKQCTNCHEAYGKPEDLRQFRNGVPCRRCGQPLKLADYWKGGPAKSVYKDAVSQPGFVGVGGRTPPQPVAHVNGASKRSPKGLLVAFSWGFAVPEKDTPSVLFSKVVGLLRSKGLNPAETFYAAETGVDPAYQSRGVGGMVSYARLRAAREAGFKGVTFRTINPKMVAVFKRFFGDDNVRDLFPDPDPVKADRIWYYCRFDQLQDLKDAPKVPKPRAKR